MNKKVIIGISLGLVIVLVGLFLVGDGGDKEKDLSKVEVPDAGGVVEDGDYEEVAIPSRQGPAGSSSGTRDADTRFYEIVFEDGKISPKTIIINKEDSVRLRIKSGDGEDYNFTINEYAQSKDVSGDGSVTEIRFSAYSVGEFPITCLSCDEERVGTFVVTPGGE